MQPLVTRANGPECQGVTIYSGAGFTGTAHTFDNELVVDAASPGVFKASVLQWYNLYRLISSINVGAGCAVVGYKNDEPTGNQLVFVPNNTDLNSNLEPGNFNDTIKSLRVQPLSDCEASVYKGADYNTNGVCIPTGPWVNGTSGNYFNISGMTIQDTGSVIIQDGYKAQLHFGNSTVESCDKILDSGKHKLNDFLCTFVDQGVTKTEYVAAVGNLTAIKVTKNN